MNEKIEDDFAAVIQGAYKKQLALLLGNGINRVNPMSLSWDYPSRVVPERRRALNGVCEPIKQRFSFLESKTCIGDALTVRYGCILTARDKMALDHQRSNR